MLPWQPEQLGRRGRRQCPLADTMSPGRKLSLLAGRRISPRRGRHARPWTSARPSGGQDYGPGRELQRSSSVGFELRTREKRPRRIRASQYYK